MSERETALVFRTEPLRLRRVANFVSRCRVELAIMLLILTALGPLAHKYGAQQASRYALTAAVVEEGTIRLDEYIDVLGIDRSVYQGHVYSDKAPGQSLLAVPFYALFRLLGGAPGTVLQIEGNVGLWWLTMWFAVLPGAILGALMYRYARKISPERALSAALGIVFGSLLLPFAALLFGHVLAALLGFGAWLVLGDGLERRRVLYAGGLVGAAVSVEYTMAIIAVVLGAFVLLRKWRLLSWYVLGGLPFATGLAAYNWAAFGDPFTISYQLSAFNGVPERARAITSIFGSLQPGRFIEVFLAPRGLLVATPLVVVGLVGVVLMLRQRAYRSQGIVAGAVFLGFLLIPLMWGNPWGGDSPGARYMVPALPFLAAPIAVAWRRFQVLSGASAVVGIFTMGLATVTDPLLPRGVGYGLGTWISLALQGEWVSTVFTFVVGDLGWLIHVTLIFVSALVLRSAWRHREGSDVPGPCPESVRIVG